MATGKKYSKLETSAKDFEIWNMKKTNTNYFQERQEEIGKQLPAAADCRRPWSAASVTTRKQIVCVLLSILSSSSSPSQGYQILCSRSSFPTMTKSGFTPILKGPGFRTWHKKNSLRIFVSLDLTRVSKIISRNFVRRIWAAVILVTKFWRKNTENHYIIDALA